MDAKVKITVLRRTRHEDLLAQHATSIWEPCDRFTEGQEFISEHANMPEGFCSWAWCDIQKYVLTLARGGNMVGSRPGRTVACCSDGYRPVFFLIERQDEPPPVARPGTSSACWRPTGCSTRSQPAPGTSADPGPSGRRPRQRPQEHHRRE